jgi:hypothetical protein
MIAYNSGWDQEDRPKSSTPIKTKHDSIMVRIANKEGPDKIVAALLDTIESKDYRDYVEGARSGIDPDFWKNP